MAHSISSRVGFLFSTARGVFPVGCGFARQVDILRPCISHTRSFAARIAALKSRQQLDEEGREYIRLDGFLKAQGLVTTGGQAKIVIQEGEVMVNGTTETRRGRKLHNGDVVAFESEQIQVEFVDGPKLNGC